MITLTHLRLKAFRSFAEESVIEFPASGMVLIRGRKEDGGSSGAGKSSVLLAISYALGFSPYPGTELQSDVTEDTMKVELGFQIGEEAWKLTRTPGSVELVDGNGTKTKGKPAEAKLQVLLGVPSEMLEALTYRAQKTPGRFISKSDSEKKEFLSGLLGLERFEDAAEAAGKEANAIPVDGFQNQAVEYKNYALAEKAKMDELGNELLNMNKTIDSADTALREATERYRAADAMLMQAKIDFEKALESVPAHKELYDLRQLYGQMKKKITDLTSDDKKRQRQAEGTFYLLQQDLIKAEKELAKIDSVERDIARLTKQRDSSSDVCPTCKRGGWERHDHTDVSVEIENLERQRLEITEKWGPRRDDLNSQIERGLQFRTDPNIEKLTKAVQELEQRIQVAEADLAAQKKAATVEAATIQAGAQEEVEKKRRTVSDTQTNYRVLVSQAEAKASLIVQTKERHKSWSQKAEEAILKGEANRRQIALLKDFQSLVGREGFLGAIFDEVLAEITDETNRVLAQVPNTDTVTLRFDSEAVTQKGTTKRAIVPVLSVGGQLGKLQSRCSGGMMTSVELAVDLAVAEVISRRTNSAPGWLCLDESFDGLDLASKEAAFSLLQGQARKKLILVVDHSESFSELFAETITVVAKDGKSKIESGV